jgi:ornithine decarboxylase
MALARETMTRPGQQLQFADPSAPAAVRALVAQFGSPLLVLDLDVVRRQYAALTAALPGVTLYYALKPLPDLQVVREIAALGGCFDLATTGEVRLVERAGVPASRCIHTHPIKRERDILEALDYGVTTFVADNADEIAKFAPFSARARLLLRISFRSPGAVSDLSKKFGCRPEDTPALLRLARQRGVEVAGLSFHVGSQVPSPDMHVAAIRACGELIADARAQGHPLSVLDIGGGFAVAYRRPVLPIDVFCAPIRAALAALPADVRVIAEPGRFIVAPAGVAVSSVMGRAERGGRMWYYLDDGVYGTFSGRMFESMEYPIAPLDRAGPVAPSVLAGPTCDSVDIVAEDIELPRLEIGDLVIARVTGAYTAASATDFNFFPRARVVYVNTSV